MTTSTDKAPPKPKKAKGPIRWEAVIPIVVIVALVGLYFSLFFDGHMRRALEYVGTQVNGAEVNVGRLSTSFLGASLELDDIQITDKNKPERNTVQVGAIRFKMLWDALLRAKVVVEESSILNIQALTPRKSPGYVVPPPPPEKPGSSAIEKAQAMVLKQTRKKFNENFLGDIAAVLGGTDPKEQLKNLQAELKSDARIQQLEAELKVKRTEWEKRIRELPQQQELKAYEARVKALRFDVNKPAELASNLKEADKIYKEIDGKVKLVEATSKDVNGQVNQYSQSFKDLEAMVQEDIRDLQKRLKIPNIDSKEFSRQIFMQMIEQKLGSFAKYIAVARKYMPPKKTAAEKLAEQKEAVDPPKRGEGRTYRFPITVGYPLFWLKHAAISSELGQSELSGNVKGEILDLSTDPVY
nr:TIGR03545 family protein [Bdellovibrionales bacterium]